MKLKSLLILLLIFLFNTSYAESFYHFYLHELDLSEYPYVKIKGVLTIEEFPLEVNNDILEIKENDLIIKNKELNIKKLDTNLKIIEIKYLSLCNKNSYRKLDIKYDDDETGFHNRSGWDENDNSIYNRYFFKNTKQDKSVTPICYNVSYYNYLSKICNNYFKNNGIEEKYVIAQSGLNIREKPDVNSPIIGKLKNGIKCKVSLKRYGNELVIKEDYDFNITGKFRKIKYKKKDGYIYDGYLSYNPLFDKNQITYKQYLDSLYLKIQEIDCFKDYDSDSMEMVKKYNYDKTTNSYDLELDHHEKLFLVAQALFGDLKNYSSEIKIERKLSNKTIMFKSKETNLKFKILDSFNEGRHIIW